MASVYGVGCSTTVLLFNRSPQTGAASSRRHSMRRHHFVGPIEVTCSARRARSHRTSEQTRDVFALHFQLPLPPAGPLFLGSASTGQAFCDNSPTFGTAKTSRLFGCNLNAS